MKHIFMTGLFLLSVLFHISAQTVTGVVENDLGEKLFGATVTWEGSSTGTVADLNGYFSLPAKDTTANLAIDYVGYETVFIAVSPGEDSLVISINGIHDLMTVEVAAEKRDNYVSTLTTLNTEIIGAGELRKAPCCSLAESFETNASVDVMYADALTGIREINFLGLRGAYTQMTVEKRPALGGLGSAFMPEFIPGTWLSSIQIAKGAGSVQSGYTGITGQINTELVKPFQDHPLFVNIYGSSFGRGEINIHANHEFNDRWSGGVLLNGSTRHNELDDNKDGFYDTPQKDMLDGMARLFYRGNDIRAQFNVHALSDKHTAGQIIPDDASSTDPFYRINQDNERVELFGKMGFIGFEDPNKSMGLITNASWHKLNSNYGSTLHRGDQRNLYINYIYSTIIDDNTSHQMSMGASYLYDDYVEMYNDVDYSRVEKVPGVFAEYTFQPEEENHEGEDHHSFVENIGLVIGLRVDKHNLFGWLVTPRINAKYNFSPNSIIRLSGGRGYRTANPIVENVGLLATNRTFVRTEELDMERAWNFGFNFTQNFTVFGKSGSFATDLYRTQFDNQVIVDREHVFREIWLYNLDGKSYANSLVSVLSYTPIRGLDLKVAYKYNEVEMDFLHGFHQMNFIAKHRGLITADYETPDKNWRFNTSMKLVGRQRFPDNFSFPVELHSDHLGFSPRYSILNTQVTRKFGELEIYLGAENLTGTTQPNPVIDPDNPFGEYFDASQVYAPITGTMGYFGLRWGLK